MFFFSPNTNIVIATAGEMKIAILEGGEVTLSKLLTQVTHTQGWLLMSLNIPYEHIILQRQETR